MNPKHPIYIVSKNRWESRLTSKALEYMNVPYSIIVEGHEYDNYASVIDPSKILVLPQEYINGYDTFWPKDVDQRTGPGAARNFAWDHSIGNGHKYHWVMDDNLIWFWRLNRNDKHRTNSGTVLRCMEDFTERYTNVAISGPNYNSFCKKTDPVPPFIMNTRIYSCLLIKNDIPYRWRGRYNEDTDLSLRVLKDGFCTIQFNAFLAEKVTTQRMSGGNTEEFYKTDGTKDKSQMLVDMHPDVAKVVWKFNRWHHHVDYRPFKKNRLAIDPRFVSKSKVNEYGMVLRQVER